MSLKLIPSTPKKSLNAAYLKVRPLRSEIDAFKANLITLIDKVDESEREENQKNHIRDFLVNTYYGGKREVNTKGTIDLVIHTDNTNKSSVGVIIEAKRPSNKSEWITADKPNGKAMQELVLYYMRERVDAHNIDIKHIILTNIYEWYVIDAVHFDKLFYQNKKFVKAYESWRDGQKVTSDTGLFYTEIAKPYIDEINEEVPCTYFDIRAYEKELRNADKDDDNKLIELYKLLSEHHLLNVPFANDSNSLDKRFYTELLHIIGLTESKEGSKKLIGRHKEGERHSGTILEDAIIQIEAVDKLNRVSNVSQYGSTKDEPMKKKISEARGKAEKLGQDIINLTAFGQKIDKKLTKDHEDAVARLNKLETERDDILSNKIYENAFEWRFEFPEVLSDEGEYLGFDVVIGNPPYGVKLEDATINILKNNYPNGNSGILHDSYFSFIILGHCLGGTDCILSYIIPNTWRLINSAYDFRSDSLSNFGLYKIDTFLKPVFDEAVVDCDIVFYNKKVNENILLIINDGNKQLISNKISVVTIKTQNIINPYLTENQYILIEKLRRFTETLKNIVSIKNGVKPYEVGKGTPKQTKETLIEKPFTKSSKVDESFVPLIAGSDFQRYSLKWNEDNYISYGPWLAAPRDSEIFEISEKIIVRQTSDKLIATIIGKGFIMRNNTHVLLSDKPTYKLKFILALLNSKLFEFIYWTINPEKGEALAEVKAMHLDQLPIKLTDKKNQEKFETLVDQILTMKSQDNSAYTTDLESQIDQLVYELYGLTEDEIAIVEGNG